jgi:hypothetical protein
VATRWSALVGAGARGVHLSLGRLDVSDLAQLGHGEGEGIGVLFGDLLQRGDEFRRAGDAERDGLPAGLFGALALGLRFPLAALAVRQRVVLGVVAVLRLGAASVLGCGGGLVTARVGAGPGGRGCCHITIIFHFNLQYNAMQ